MRQRPVSPSIETTAHGWSVSARQSQRSSSVRTVFDACCYRLAAPLEKRIYFEFEADGFLYNMVCTPA